MNERIIRVAEEWLAIDPCKQTREEVAGWVEKIRGGDEEALRHAKSRLCKRVGFGTAGLRAEMGAGYACMNDLVVIQTAQGLAAYLEVQLGASEVRQRGIVVGYDHRQRGEISSRSFAMVTAAVFLAKGIKVELFSELVCTPLVPFTVDRLGCAAGIMITASHNPKNDNGYKVYWGNGCQIIPPHDKGIAESILRHLKPAPLEATEAAVRGNDLCHDPFHQMVDDYIETVGAKLCHHENANASSRVRVTYTAMHGVGTPFVKRVFAKFGLSAPALVEEQVEPNPSFPTVEYPNPEEGDGALALAYQTAEASASRLILANDPDADRLAVAERRVDGTWKVFSGNEIGVLLGYWMLLKDREKNGSGGKVAMVGATVSSKMLRAIGEKEGFLYEETLTGFKWIGNRSAQLREEGYRVVFAFEQAIGFCLGDVVKDKDGVSAAAVFAEMAGQLPCSCEEQLQMLKRVYGYFEPNEHYVIVKEAELIDAVFERLRNQGRYWLACRGYKIAHVRDLRSPGYDSSSPNGMPTLPVSSSNMLTYTFENGFVLTLRPSGTEPKLKYYAEGRGNDPSTLKKEVQKFVDEVVLSEMLKPVLATAAESASPAAKRQKTA